MFWFGVPVGIGDRAKRRFQRTSNILALLSTIQFALERRVTQSKKSLQRACKLVELFLCRLLIHGAEIVELIGCTQMRYVFPAGRTRTTTFLLADRKATADCERSGFIPVNGQFLKSAISKSYAGVSANFANPGELRCSQPLLYWLFRHKLRL